MKNALILLTLVAFAITAKSQTVVDACFTSVPYATSFVSSATLANTTDADMLEWTGSAWLGQWGAANITTPPPCTGVGQKAVWMGDQNSWTTGGEGFAMKLSSPLVAGQTYSYTFTYISNGLYSNGAFAPYILTNSIADYGTAYSMGSLPAVGNTWTTNTYTFTATASQNNHEWLILHSNTGSGSVISFCAGQATVSAGSDTTICIGDSVLLTAGNGFNSYSWSNGASTQSTYVATAGTYVVLATGTCGFAIDSVVVTTQVCAQSPVVAFSSSDTSFCEKQCIDFFDLTTHSPTSWQWLFTGATPDTSTLQNPTSICYNNYGAFNVQLIACNATGCDTLNSINFITELQNPVDSIWQIGVTLYSLPAYSYQWYELNAGLITGATDSFYIATIPGSYYCVVADTIGCIASSNIIAVTDAGVNDLSGNTISIYPNPCNGTFNLDLNSENIKNASLKVFDRLGRKVFESEINSAIQNFELKIADGIYHIAIGNNGIIENRILIIRNP